MDFSGGHLNSLRFIESRIEDCVFDDASCQDWRIWGTTVTNSRFRRADLRRSVLGPVEDGKRNRFQRVDFSGADLRATVYVSADVIECQFEATQLTKVDFQGTVFVDSVFAGELREVMFYRHAFREEDLPANEMLGVDFGRATLHHVEFRGLDMKNVRWPEDDGHVLVSDYSAALERMMKFLEGRSGRGPKALAAIVASKLKWAGQRQMQGILNRADLVDAGGEEVVAELLEACVSRA